LRQREVDVGIMKKSARDMSAKYTALRRKELEICLEWNTWRVKIMVVEHNSGSPSSVP